MPSTDAGERYELLLVEDSPGDVDLIRERLSDVPGYRFVLTTAQSLAEAFRCLAAARFDRFRGERFGLGGGFGVEDGRRRGQKSEKEESGSHGVSMSIHDAREKREF